MHLLQILSRRPSTNNNHKHFGAKQSLLRSISGITTSFDHAVHLLRKLYQKLPSHFAHYNHLLLHITGVKMGIGGRTRVAIEGPNLRSAANLGDGLCFTNIPPPSLAPIPSVDQGAVGDNDVSAAEDIGTAVCPPSPILEAGLVTETTEVASIPELSLGSSALSHVFPHSILLPTTAQPKPDNEPISTPLTPPKVPPRPTKGYLHRTPTGRLTEIGPSPLCQETTKTLVGEVKEKEDDGVIYAGYRIFKRNPRDSGSLKAKIQQDVPLSDREEAGTGLSYVGYKMNNRDPRVFLRSKSICEQYNSSSDKKNADTSQDATSENNAFDYYADYPGYRIFNSDPRLFLGIESGCLQNKSNSDKKQSEYSFDVELPPDGLSTDSSSAEEEDEEHIDLEAQALTISERSTRSPSTWRDLYVAANRPRPYELFFTEIKPEDYDSEVVKQSIVNKQPLVAIMQSICLQPTLTIPNRRQPLFNPILKQEVDVDSQETARINTSCSHDLARIQFKNRRGRLWDMANKNLERLFLHATELKETEFLELVLCKADEVQAWLDEHGPRLIKRSMNKRTSACETLRKAGIQPCEISEEVMDIFELMNGREQAEFIGRFQKLFALVKSSQERLHLTPSEMEHFSKLSLAAKYDWLELHKSKGEEREKMVRRDTAIFTAKLRRTYRESDEMPFADCSSPKSLRELYGSSPKTRRQNQSSDNIQRQKLPTVLTGDGRARHQKLDKSNTIEEEAQSKHVSGLVVQYNNDLNSNECKITVREVSASESERSSIHSGDMVLTTAKAAAEHQESKETSDCGNPKREVVDNEVRHGDGHATPLVSIEQQQEKKHNKDVDTEEDDMPETLLAEHVLKRSPKHEWRGVHPGAYIPLLRSSCPSPPPTECSEEVVLPVTEGKVTANGNSRTNSCINDVLPATTATSGATKSEPCTPHAERPYDVLTKDRERCSLEVEILGEHTNVPYSSRLVSYITPSHPSHGCPGELPSAYILECDWKKDGLSQKSNRSLRKKVSTFFGSLRTKRSRGALKEVKYF